MTQEKNATHIGIIMDGNRRYARKNNLATYKGHEKGAKQLNKLLEWAKDLGVRTLTLYTLSLENFNRPKDEFNHLMNLFRKEFDRLSDDKRIYENKIRIRVLGRKHMLPKDIQEKIAHIEHKTKDHDSYTLNFAMAYGGRGEIADAAKAIAQQVKEGTLNASDIDEETVKANLYLSDYPDLVIRTGGDRRTSNFFPYQCAYSEWFFVDKMWPEFQKDDFVEILEQFKNREQRFGR